MWTGRELLRQTTNQIPENHWMRPFPDYRFTKCDLEVRYGPGKKVISDCLNRAPPSETEQDSARYFRITLESCLKWPVSNWLLLKVIWSRATKPCTGTCLINNLKKISGRYSTATDICTKLVQKSVSDGRVINDRFERWQYAKDDWTILLWIKEKVGFSGLTLFLTLTQAFSQLCLKLVIPVLASASLHEVKG